MGKIENRDIYEIKPWLNDDTQTIDTLKENLDVSGGSGIPEITADDDGKVLTANVSGDTKTLTWETPSGGGGVYFIEEITDPSERPVLNKNYNEITTMISGGVLPILTIPEPGVGMTYAVLINASAPDDPPGYYVTFFDGFERISFSSETATGTLTHML